ncbi:unnamed protein product [Heligmosomoides polygyrus]|uniref:Uncharacterized protein n=1 Tax=Heligmosomoides polygyrus TaxID=6339 RepID=A0A3P7ZG90_HELPZ|nr:unnamed protein product [Heligmosomoides polygyrus]
MPLLSRTTRISAVAPTAPWEEKERGLFTTLRDRLDQVDDFDSLNTCDKSCCDYSRCSEIRAKRLRSYTRFLHVN